jgi:ParB family chromosome partitioning protein
LAAGVLRLQDDRRQRQLLADRLAELAQAGVLAVPGEEVGQVANISGLRQSATDESGTELAEEAHRGCPGHTALVTIKPGWGGRPDEVTTKWVCPDPEANGQRRRAAPARTPPVVMGSPVLGAV